MIKTGLCGLLGIEHPIILGGMLWVGRAELAAAVSEAGGLGLLGAGGLTLEQIAGDIVQIRSKTPKPFGVNIPLLRPDSEEMIKTALDHGASVIATASGNPARFTQTIKDAGAKVLHLVPNVTLAKKAEAAGVDVVVAEGYEAGGHNGRDEITTMALVPQVVRAVNVPVVAAGGIADGRGLVAALALGAQGVQMGTRFMVTHESAVHPRVKEMVLNMTDSDTCITGRTTIGPTRSVKNNLTDMIIQAESSGATPEELFEMIGEGRSAKACLEGDCQQGSVYCGQIGGYVNRLLTAAEVVESTMREAKAIIKFINDRLCVGQAS